MPAWIEAKVPRAIEPPNARNPAKRSRVPKVVWANPRCNELSVGTSICCLAKSRLENNLRASAAESASFNLLDERLGGSHWVKEQKETGAKLSLAKPCTEDEHRHPTLSNSRFSTTSTSRSDASLGKLPGVHAIWISDPGCFLPRLLRLFPNRFCRPLAQPSRP